MNSKNIRKIFHPFTKIPGVRFLFYGIYKRFIYGPVRRRDIREFQKNALPVLKEFNSTMSDNNIPYCLFWGSLIGAVREHGFIPHDFDIDVAVWKSESTRYIKEILENAGFSHVQRFLVDDGNLGMEDSFEKNGVIIDIFYFYKDINKKMPYCTTFDYINGEVSWEECFKKYRTVDMYRFYFNLPEDFILVPFESLQLPIPNNYDEILRSYYGQNYMTPDPQWGGGETEECKWTGPTIKYLRYK